MLISHNLITLKKDFIHETCNVANECMLNEDEERRQLARTCEIRQMTPLPAVQEKRNKSQGVTESRKEKNDNLKMKSSEYC